MEYSQWIYFPFYLFFYSCNILHAAAWHSDNLYDGEAIDQCKNRTREFRIKRKEKEDMNTSG